MATITNRITDNFKLIYKIFNWAILGLGVLVIFGWVTGNELITQILPSFTPMQFNTALCFAGIGLYLLISRTQFSRNFVWLPIAVSLIGLLTLCEYIFNLQIPLDNLFIDSTNETGTSHLGRMAPNTALCFFLSGISIVVIEFFSTKHAQIGGLMGTLILALGATAFTGYLVGFESSYAWGNLTKMAIHTSFGFILMGMSLGFFSQWKFEERGFEFQSENIALSYIVGLAVIILFIDISLPRGVAAGILYVLVLLVAYFTISTKPLKYIFVLTLCFVLIGYLFSSYLTDEWMVLTNRFLTVVALTVTYFLLRKIKRSELFLVESNFVLDKNVAERTKEIMKRNKELEQLTYISSHDLKEPVRITNSYAELLRETNESNLDDLGKKCLDTITASAKRIQSLIDGFFEISQLGKRSKLETVSTKELFEESIQQFSESEIEIHLKSENFPKANIYLEEFKFLIRELVQNAITFRKKDQLPRLVISGNAKGQLFEYRFTDNGIGIPQKYYERIFHIFQRLHYSSVYQGNGIGLAKAQKIVDLHGGQITVESVENEGSTFIFTIPYHSQVGEL